MGTLPQSRRSSRSPVCQQAKFSKHSRGYSSMNAFYYDEIKLCAICLSLWHGDKRTGSFITRKRWKSVNLLNVSTSLPSSRRSSLDKVTLSYYTVRHFVKGIYFLYAKTLHTVLSCPNKNPSYFCLLCVLICFLNACSHLMRLVVRPYFLCLMSFNCVKNI